MLCAPVGPRWRRESALPEFVAPRSRPVAPLQSAFLDTTRLTRPAAVPGPYTPPPASAVVSADLAPWTPIREPRRRRGPVLLAGGTLAVAAVVAAVVLLGGGGKPDAAPADRATTAPDQTVSAGPLSIVVPGDWDGRPDATAPVGLDLEGATRVTPPGGGGAVTVGMAPASTTTHALLPKGLLAEGGEAPERTEVGLGDARAYRYDALPGGARAFVVPTEDGVATVACEPPVTDACDQVASTLKVPEVVPLGTDADFAALLRDGIDEIDGVVSSMDGAVAARDRPADDAERIRATFARLARTLDRFDTRPADRRSSAALQRAATAEATAYERLASAARRSDRGAYRRAARAARGGQRELEAALAALTLAGYEPIDAPRAPSIGALAAPVAEPASTPRPTPAPTTAAPTPTATTSYLPAPIEPTPERRSSGPIDPGSGG